MERVTYRGQSKGVAGLGVCLWAGLSGFALNAAAAPDPTCVSYLTVGDSDCSKLKAPKQVPTPFEQAVRNVEAVPVQSEVDKYLENYGKPPREFVEFYLNPTAENAARWVATYQQMLQKGQDLSKAWSDAEQLYGSAQAVATGMPEPVLVEPFMVPPAAQPVVPSTAPASPVSSAPLPRFGAFANAPVAVVAPVDGIRTKGVSLTYFFSQTCPYCTRMTPELAVLTKEIKSKLAFTCVDVTPVGATVKPDESYITSKLPCQWRLPHEGEVEREQVSQTPTLIIQKEGEVPVRLSGYVPLAQLRGYF